jgi:ribosomal protein S18 acetylase RimI-like enzyme
MPSRPIDIVALDRSGLDRHLDALAEILHACVHDGASVSFILPFAIDQARAFWVEKVAPGVAADKRIVLLATMDGQAAGTVQLDLDTTPNQRHRAEIAKLLVHPRYRRSGIARALMRHIESLCADRDRWLLTLDTAGDAAEALYASLGYERVGRIPFYARDPIVDRFDATTIMFKILRPEGDRRFPSA